MCVDILAARLEYGVIHSGACFVIFRVAQASNGEVPSCLISDTIRLTESTTPIIQVILSLVLRASTTDVASPYQGPRIEATNPEDGSEGSKAAGESNRRDVALNFNAFHILRQSLEGMNELALAGLLRTVRAFRQFDRQHGKD